MNDTLKLEQFSLVSQILEDFTEEEKQLLFSLPNHPKQDEETFDGDSFKRIKTEEDLNLSIEPGQLFVDKPDDPALFSDESNQEMESLFASLSAENPIGNEGYLRPNVPLISQQQDEEEVVQVKDEPNVPPEPKMPPEPNVSPDPKMPFEPKKMKPFPREKVSDFKHVIYNLLVDAYNNHGQNAFVRIINQEGKRGFQFVHSCNPEKFLPELYALHIRKCRLDQEDYNSIPIQDLYKFYLRACVELLGKYFVKREKYTFLYENIPLFVENESLHEAEQRIRKMKTRARNPKRKRI